ncbi:hypothetical protein EKO04_009629 [Ascochyta lentis]|uniref:RBR-type E3 ubiquitin transferase n=1 Tax=Ascochyta lentis TaxID=205686 RepID=A0A8H7IXJ5_9PLEO|nr:hypothetical protein EKO04_009629 [Ascochyta lentis]
MHVPDISVVCSVRYCGRLVSAALPTPTRSPLNFDTKAYCSKRCAGLYARGEHRKPSAPLITCDICVEDKLLTDYIHKIEGHGAVTEQWNVSIPHGCLPHIAPELLNMEGGICTDCLQTHILTQFGSRGAINIACIHTYPPAPAQVITPDDVVSTLTASTHNWLPYAHRFVPPEQHSTYFQQLFDSFIHTTGRPLWACPSNCGCSNFILEPKSTPGFPHVECPGCHVRFCANCKVNWHTDQTCQEYRATHPEVRDKDEEKQLREMARLGARRCPRCQFVITKDGGCDHMFCEQCHFNFDWSQAELVIAPVEIYIPAPAPAPSARTPGSAFRGWAQLRQAQEAYITRNQISDTPFNIGNDNSNSNSNTTHHQNNISFFDLDLRLWLPEVCELDALVAREAGKRFIRHPALDNDGQWAFIQVGREFKGGVELYEALQQEYHATHHWFTPGGWPMHLPLPVMAEMRVIDNEFPFAVPPLVADGGDVNVDPVNPFDGWGW